MLPSTKSINALRLEVAVNLSLGSPLELDSIINVESANEELPTVTSLFVVSTIKTSPPSEFLRTRKASVSVTSIT